MWNSNISLSRIESRSGIHTLPKRKEANNDYDHSYEEDAFTSIETHSRTLQEMKHFQTFSVSISFSSSSTYSLHLIFGRKERKRDREGREVDQD